MTECVDPAVIAADDQAAAHLRDGRLRWTTERWVQVAAGVFLTAGLLLGAYAYAAAAGYVPAAPWSPVGQVVDDERHDEAPPAPASPSVDPAPTDGGVSA